MYPYIIPDRRTRRAARYFLRVFEQNRAIPIRLIPTSAVEPGSGVAEAVA